MPNFRKVNLTLPILGQFVYIYDVRIYGHFSQKQVKSIGTINDDIGLDFYHTDEEAFPRTFIPASDLLLYNMGNKHSRRGFRAGPCTVP